MVFYSTSFSFYQTQTSFATVCISGDGLYSPGRLYSAGGSLLYTGGDVTSGSWEGYQFGNLSFDLCRVVVSKIYLLILSDIGKIRWALS